MWRTRTNQGLLVLAMSLAAGGCIPSGTYDCSYFFVTPGGKPINVATIMEINANTLADAQAAVRREAERVQSLQSQYQGGEIRMQCTRREDGKTFEPGPFYSGPYYDRRPGVQFPLLYKLRHRQPGGSRNMQAGAAAGGPNPLPFTTSLVVEVELSKGDFSWVPAFTGGLRVQRPLNPRVDVFGQLTAGVMRFPEENAFTLKPAVGVLVPLESQPFSIYGSIGFPLVRSFGSFEREFEISGGISIPVSW
jgi:hypothetical protein